MKNNNEKTTSFFEFWPTKLMYTPVAIQWLLLSIKHGSITLPLLANPKLTLSGMVGVGKSELFQQATGFCQESILNWIKLSIDGSPADKQAQEWIKNATKQGLSLPFVCKPDIGCRGSGVKLIHDQKELEDTITSYPEGTALILQKLGSYEPEAGIFYVKMPHQSKGQVVSLTLKNSPMVIGDGRNTLKQLLQQDPRASNLLHMYQDRHQGIWNEVLEKDKKLNLIFAASHCHGAVFIDARDQITNELTDSINRMMDGLPEFYYGRLDVKFASLEELKKGKTIEIIEINGASAESIHIWDKNSKFIDAIRTLLWQYKVLFKLGAHHKQQGAKPPGIKKLYQYWKKEKNLAKYYPETD